jgi:hypothetical protein
LALGLSGCGDDEKESGGGSTVEDTNTVMSGATVGNNSKLLGQVEVGVDENALQGTFNTLQGSMQQWRGNWEASKAQADQGGSGAPTGVPGVPGLTAAEFAQSVSEITYEDDHLSAKVTYDQNGTSINYDVELDIVHDDAGNVTIDGTFKFDLQTSQGGFTVKLDYDAVYSGLTIAVDCPGGPSGGSIQLDYVAEVSGANIPAGAQGAGGGEGSLTATWETCGEPAVIGR